MLTLCFTSQQQPQSQQRRVVLEFSPDATVQELRHAAQQAFVLVDTCTKNNTTTNNTKNVLSLELYAGFPPRRLDNDSMTLRDAGLQHQDRIGVTLLPRNEEEEAHTTTNTTTNTPTTNNTTTTQRSRRSAAVAATKRIAHEIQQEQSVATTQTTKTKGKATAKATKSKNTKTTSSTTARHFAALATVSTSSISSPRRLRDGAVVSTTTTNNNHKKRRHQLPHAEDGNLLEALVGSSRNSNSSSALLLRRGWRAAVQSVYEQNQAAARVATRLDQIVWQSQQSSSSSPNTDNNNNDEPPQHTTCWWNVSYPKGVQGRPQRRRHMKKDQDDNTKRNDHPFHSSSSTYTDVNVPILDATVLHAVVPPIHARHPEGLRPENLALLSPRVLWSLVHLYQQQQNQPPPQSNHSTDTTTTTSTNTPTVGEIIPQALRHLQPHLDWSFLRRRPVTLSAKARENLRQQQQQQEKQSSQTQDDDHWEAAATAMQAVERALRGEEEEEEEANATIIIRTGSTTTPAATTNNNNNNTNTMLPEAWTVSTPDEVDDDELLECVHAAVPEPQPLPPPEDAVVLSFSCKSIVSALHELNIHNWRELANVELRNAEDNDDHDNDDSDDVKREENDFYTRLRQVLEQQPSQPQLQPTTEDNNNNNTIPVSRTTVQAWIDCAQFQSVQEIMVECCENHVDAVDVLLDTVRCGTPRDLILWHTIVPVLQREIVVRWRRRNKAKDMEDEEDALDWLHRLPVWCHRAQCALEQLPWLRQYVTPIVTDDDDNDDDDNDQPQQVEGKR